MPALLTVTSALDPANLTAGTLRAAVLQANADAANGSSDTIVFNTSLMGGGTVSLQRPLELTAGVGATTIDGGGQVTLSGNNAGLLFLIDKGAQATLTGLTLEDGAGNVVNAGTTTTVNGATAPVTSSFGGAIDNAGTLTVNQSLLTGNVAAGLYGYGGAIYNSGTLTVTASTLSGNSATVVAGWGGGGAIYNAGSLTLTNATLANNTLATVSTVTGLSASPSAGGGGALDNVGTAIVTGSTVAGNAAPTGGGIDNAPPGLLLLSNTLVATNSASTAPDISGVVSGTHNLVGSSSGLSGIANHDAGSNLVGTASKPLNPLLGPLGNDGGPVPTLALLAGSPAIATGAASSSLTTDERGLPRPSTPDIGAFQTQPAVSLAVTAPGPVIAGVAFPVTLTALDQYGNPVTNYSGSATLSSSDGQTVYLSASAVSLVNGSATVTLTLENPNSVTLKAVSGALTGSAPLTVNPAVASFAVSTPGAATAGAGFAVTVTAKDRFGNTVSGYNGPVTLTSSDGQPVLGLPASLTLSNGSAVVNATLNKAGTATLTASAGSVLGSSGAITVSPAAATSFVVSAPATAGAGASFPVTLTAEDAYGNVVTGYNDGGTLTLSSSDGQSVALSPSPLAWSNGTATAAVTLANPDPNPVRLTATAGGARGTSAGFVVESPASQAISNGLAALVSWAGSQSFPLVGTATALQNALQLGLLNPVNSYLAHNTPTSPGFLTLLQGLSAQIGGLTVTVAPGSVQQTVNGTKVSFSLDFQASLTTPTSLQSLGAPADKLGIRLNPDTPVSVTTGLHFSFSFGVDQTAGLSPAQAFFLSAPAGGLSASVTINATNIIGGVTLGFLGAQTSNGTIQMSAQAANAASLSGAGLSALQGLSLSPTGSFKVVLPVQTHLGTQSTSGTVTISDANLASGAPPTVAFSGLGGWQNFTTVGPDAVLGLLDQLDSQLGQVASQVWSNAVPFLGGLSLAQAADIRQAFATEVTSQIASWNATLRRNAPDFSTAQDLAALLARALDVSPSKVGISFNPSTNNLTYTLSFTAYTFSGLLSQALQVNLNQGGLTNAALTGGQLSLIPKLTAGLTFGINLTPLGQGFTLSASTALSSLNGGAGVRVNSNGTPDLQVTLTDGSSFQVSLSGAQTVQDVINDIQAASGGKVAVQIDPTSQQSLDLIQVTPPTGSASNSSPNFTVAAINGSSAALDLGIAGSDVDRLGTITGQSLSGDTFAKHFFVQNVSIQASVAGTASNVTGTADVGIVALNLVNGKGSVQMQGSLALPGPTTLAQLTSALGGGSSLSSLVSPQVSGTAQLSLPLHLAVPVSGITLPSGAAVAVSWTDVTDPSTLSVTVSPALSFSGLSMQPILQGLQNVAGFVQGAGASLLSQQLPGLGVSLAGVVDPSALFNTALNGLTLNAPATIDQLLSQLSTALGQPVTVSYLNNQLRLNLKYGFSGSRNVNLGFNLSPSLGGIADVNGTTPVSLSASGTANLGLVIDFSNPSAPQAYLQDTSTISVNALVNASGIAFNASIGPLGVSIANGTARLDNGTQGHAATWTLGLQTSTTNGLWSLASAANEITSTVVGQVNVVLPTFFPTPDQPLDPSTPNIELHVTNLASPATTTTVVVPNVSTALSSVNLNNIMDQLVNGWDGVMRMLQSALTRQIDAANIPVVGQQLQQALSFLRTLDQKVTTLLQNAPQLAAQTVQDALYHALGPGGLNWLVDLNPADANPGENDYVQLQQSAGNIHYYLQLHEGLAALSVPLGVNLGLPGLGLAVNGNLTLNAGFDAQLGFGLSQQSGFYVDSCDTASVGFNAQLLSGNNPVLTATLGFLQFNVTNNAPQTPLLSGGLSVALTDVHGNGQLSLADLASASTYNVGLNASANVQLHLDASLGGNTNLPHVSTDFAFIWSTNPTAANPNTLGFNNVTLDMGGLIDGIANQIKQVLAPVKPLADVLTAPLPVISQLAGHNVDLLDLASALGFVSPSTAQFLNAVSTFVNGGGLNVPTSMDLGSFTLDLSAAENASSLGNLNPASTDITASYTGNPITGFQVPILSNPSSAFQLLLGKDVPLVTYETPQLNLSFSFDQFFPIIGPLGADLQGAIGAQAQFGFGFDTSGFRQYAASGYRDPSLILDGFYVSDRQNPDGTGPVAPQAQLYGDIAAYAALDLGIAEAGVGGGIYASANFTVHDPSGTGKVHLQDLAADVQKGTIFDASGALQAFLNAFVKIDLGIVSHTWNFNIASVTLAQIAEPAPSTPPVPQLATLEPGGALRLNIGPYAAQRLYGNTVDGSEALTVTQGPTANSVYVSGFGVTNQEYDNVSAITGEGAAGNDTVTINVGGGINVNLATGGGSNKIDVQSAGNVTLTGGAGSDTLEVDSATSAVLTGGSGTEELDVRQDGGPATLQAGGGTDLLYGGSGANQVLQGSTGTALLVAGPGANQVLDGGSGTATLVGGSGAGQQLLGDTSTATLFGGTGANQTLNAGTGNASLYAGEADGQTLVGGSGDDVLQVGWHLNNPGAAVSFSNLPVGALDPTTGQPLKPGWHLQESLTSKGWTVTNYTPGDSNQGAGHSYVMIAGTGNTLAIGGFGDDTIYGGSGNNTLYGGGNGTKVLYAGTGATQLYGGGPGDNVSPSTGTHILYGGSGTDVLYGGDGANIAVNPAGNGLVTAAGDSGDNGTNILAAGSGNTTIYADSAGSNQSTLIAGSGLDKLFAGGDNGDYLEAGSGVDSLYGGTGDDVLQVPFIPAGQSAATPDTLVGGYGLTTLVLKPVNTALVNGQLTQQSLTTDSSIYLTGVAGTTNEYTATLNDLDSGSLVGQVQFTLPGSVQRIALMGGLGDNHITVDPSVQRGIFLYGGAGHNVLQAGSGNDVLVGGGGTSILQGGSGNDVLYGGAMPAVYQPLINALGSGSSGTGGGATTDPLLSWLRQQPAGHNVLIAGSGNSQLYAGNGGDLLIGGNAQFNAQTGQFGLQPGAGRDLLMGGGGNDLMIGGLGGLGDVMLAGTGNDVLIGGNGENVLEGPPGGGGGSDVLIGGSLINILMSNDAAGQTSYLLGGSGLNFEFAGSGNDQLFDYSNPNDPLQAGAWSRVQALAAQYDLVLPPLASTNPVNPVQAYQDLLTAQNDLSAEFALLNTIYKHSTQTGTITAGSNTVSNLYFLKQSGTVTKGSNVVTGLDTTNLIAGELVSGNGIPAGTTLSIPVDSQGNPIAGEVVLSNVATVSSSVDPLTFSDPILVAPTWETGTLTKGSTTLSHLALQTALAGYTTKGSATVTHLASTQNLAVGDTVTGPGIPTGATIVKVLDNSSVLLSKNATVTSTKPVLLSISTPLAVGMPVTGTGIPAGTIIASVVSGTTVTLSNAATASATSTLLCFGSLPFAGPLVSAASGLPSGDSVASVVSGSAVSLTEPATQTAANVQLTFTFTPQEEQQREALDTALQLIAAEEVNALKQLGANAEIDVLQGGSGTDALYAGPSPAWMLGTTGSDTFYITPQNDQAFAQGEDIIEGSKSASDTLMFLADGNINLSYNSNTFADVVTINNQAPLSWVEGNNISTVGVQTMGGNDTVTIGSAKFGSWTGTIRVIDGGVAGNPALEGNVTIDATTLTEQAFLRGGAGNDTIKIDRLATGSVVQGGTGNGQRNELDILGDSGGGQVFEGTNPLTGHEDLQTYGGTWVGAKNFQTLVVVGGSATDSSTVTNTVSLDGSLIANAVLEGGDGTNVSNAFTVYGDNNVLIGGTGANSLTAGGGANTLFGGTGRNTFNLTGN